METSLIQTRVDTELKNDAIKLFDGLGLGYVHSDKNILEKVSFRRRYSF